MSQKIITYGLESEKAKGPEWLKTISKEKLPASFYIELEAFGRGGTEDLGGENKEYHAKQFIGAHYPWVKQHWNDWLDLELWAWCNYEEVGATGCMASGKSYGFSFLAWLEWMAAPLKSACVLSSTTKPALKSRIWYHIKKFRAGLYCDKFGTFVHPCHLIDSQTMIQGVKGDDMHVISAVAVQGGQLEQAIGNVQGRHPQRMITFVDEGEQTPEAIFSARLNLRGGTTFSRFVSCANAVNPYSAYGQFIEPKGGWPAAKDSDEYWETKTGICLHFDGRQSPNVKAGKVIVPGLIKQEDIDSVRKAKGEDSLEWWMYVVGFPAMSGVRNTVLSWAHINSSGSTKGVIWQGETKWKGALDPAFTSGGDKCVLRFARLGSRDDGKFTLGLEAPIEIKLVANGPISEDYQIAERVKEECEKRKMDAGDFGMDATAATSLASIIEQRWKPGIKRINFGAGATDRKMPDEEKTAKERCRNRVAEMWFAFAALVRSGQVRGLDPEAAQEFCMRQYELQGERYILESKSDMKARTGGKSPDVADASVILGDLFRDVASVDSGTTAGTADAWEKASKKHNLVSAYR